MVVLDTSTLLYWTLDPARLSERAKQTLDATDSILVSSISIWEIGIKLRRGKLLIPLPLRAYAANLDLVEKVEIVPVTVELWIESIELRWRHKDPADRVIVATAVTHGCSLITSDRVIRRFYRPAIW